MAKISILCPSFRRSYYAVGDILSMVIVSLVTTTVLTYSFPVRYTATATLIIDFNEPAETEDNQVLSPFLQPKYMATQVGIIQSHHVALRVVDNLKFADNAGWRAKFIEGTDGKGEIRHWLGATPLEDLTVVADSKSRLVTIVIRLQMVNSRQRQLTRLLPRMTRQISS